MNSKQWWEAVKQDTNKLNNWLKKQYFGENQAYIRITELSERFDNKTLKVIADQEKQHSEWIRDYCLSKNIDISNIQHEERYWKEVNMDFESLEEAAAVGAHAEKMRLERIEVIANDPSFCPDLSDIFKNILKDEIFHERAFKDMTTEELYELNRHNHEKGAEKIGLTV